MRYHRFDELQRLVETKMVSCRLHPIHNLNIYNYTPAAAFLPPAQWSDTLRDARGLILDFDGEIVGRGFRKFWNYEQMLDQIPVNEPYEIWEKVDGSLGIVCNYRGNLVVATRGSFESDQAKWAAKRFEGFLPPEGSTFLFEFVYPANRIVVDYGADEKTVLLAIVDERANIMPNWDMAYDRWPVAKRHFCTFATMKIPFVEEMKSLMMPGPWTENREGYVLRFKSGFQCKIKFEEYKRLHRLITQCSTRTIWELLRAGKGIQELVDRVPADFSSWVTDQANAISSQYEKIMGDAKVAFRQAPGGGRNLVAGSDFKAARKAYAQWALQHPNWSLLFSQLDGKDISDDVWKLVEPKWATPFRKEPE